MKKNCLILLALVAALTLVFVACQNDTTTDTDPVTEAPTTEATEAPTEEVTEPTTDEATEAPTTESTEAPTEDVTETPTEEVTTEEVTEAPTEPPRFNSWDDKSVVAHLSFDQLYTGTGDSSTGTQIFAPGGVAGWDYVADMTEMSEQYLTVWGWIGAVDATFPISNSPIRTSPITVARFLSLKLELLLFVQQCAIRHCTDAHANDSGRYHGCLIGSRVNRLRLDRLGVLGRHGLHIKNLTLSGLVVILAELHTNEIAIVSVLASLRTSLCTFVDVDTGTCSCSHTCNAISVARHGTTFVYLNRRANDNQQKDHACCNATIYHEISIGDPLDKVYSIVGNFLSPIDHAFCAVNDAFCAINCFRNLSHVFHLKKRYALLLYSLRPLLSRPICDFWGQRSASAQSADALL